LIFFAKLFLSAATLCIGLGYGARHRANALHRRLMALGVALAWLGAAVVLAGRAGFALPLHPAYWLVELTGSDRAAGIVAAVQQGLGVAVLLALTGQAVLGRLRHPWHRPLAWVALPAWLALWVSSMFGYV
jgi:hypothetical protein